MKNIFPLLLSLVALAVAHADGQYHFIKEIPVGGDGGWDWCSVDEGARRLYVSHATKVVVIDVDSNSVVGEITNTPGVHSIAIAPKLNRCFVSNGRSNNVSIVDLKTLQTLAHVETEKGPDGMLFDPEHDEVYAFNGHSESATIFAAASGKVITNLALGGKPEFAQVDVATHRVYVNIEDKSELAAIDTQTHTLANRWPIAPGEEASGLAFDQNNHRLFLGCGNKLMVMIDSTSGKVLASVPIGEGVDAAMFDPATQLAFAPCGDGTTTIAHEDGGKLAVVQTLVTTRGARTMALDPKSHRIYLGAARYETTTNTPAANSPRQRPKMIPGSFKVLVYGMDREQPAAKTASAK
jgi:YVTN family beta-propeller protein